MQPEFALGARNAVRTCLNIGPGDRVCIIRDRPRQHIAEAIEKEAQATGADWDCPSHVDVLASHATVSVDGRTIMENGRFLV